MEDKLNLQWFPGHMAKTRRQIKEDLSRVDAVVEIADARIPRSSRNPELPELVGRKPRLLLLNKSDLADAAANQIWMQHYRAAGTPALLVDCLTGRGLDRFVPTVRELLSEKLERDAQRGMKKAIRLMVVGVPNSGKSSFINRLAGGKRAKVEDRPGVTRSNQWIRLQSGLELLDTPGVLWPRFEDQWTGLALAFTGAIRDDATDMESVAARLLLHLARLYPQLLAERYKLAETQETTGVELLCAVGRRRGFLISGGEVDTERASRVALDEFRGGKLGRLTLELPEEGNDR